MPASGSIFRVSFFRTTRLSQFCGRRSRVEGESFVDSLLRRAGERAVGPGELVFAVLLGGGFIDADSPFLGRSGPAQAQERGRAPVAGESNGDVAVSPAEADLG